MARGEDEPRVGSASPAGDDGASAGEDPAGASRDAEDAPADQTSPEVEGPLADDAAWTLYLLVSDSLTRTYAGIALDPERRLAQHNGEAPGGARATRAGRPWRLARTWGPYPDRAAAQRAEARLKRERGAARRTWAGSGEERRA